jgi:hypothetical protein
MCVRYVRDMTVLDSTQERIMSPAWIVVHPSDPRGYVGIVAEPTGPAQSVISLCLLSAPTLSRS